MFFCGFVSDEEMNELSFALETDIGEEFASPPALGMVLRALATSTYCI